MAACTGRLPYCTTRLTLVFASGRPVQAYLEPGGQLSGDLCKNVDRVSISNDLTGIGGTIPDLALHANNQPVRRLRLLLGYS